MNSPPTVVDGYSTEERLALGVRPRPNDVVVAAMERLADAGMPMGFKAVDRMLRAMWAERAKCERKRAGEAERLAAYEGGARTGRERLVRVDPVGEEAAELVDWMAGREVFATTQRVRDLQSASRFQP